MANHWQPQEVFDFESLDFNALVSSSRILIDGDNGGGKSSLAQKLISKLSATTVSLDDFLKGNGEPYWKQIDYHALGKRLQECRLPIVVEGVCALKVLAETKFVHDYMIFVKRTSGLLGWEYSQWLSPKAKLPKSKLARDIVRYYSEYRPFDRCDVIVNI